ncbi:MAG: KAP family P-loop NTPase fold protein, partial [Ginsengibacter sp.]
AWENDFDNNPLVALMAELNALTRDETKAIFKSLVKKGAVLTKNILPALLKAMAAKYIDTELIQDAIENTTKAATEILDDEIKEYTSKKEGLQEFKTKLTEFVKETKGNKPIVFIIDELDRCRPNYAVEVLEQIKHFFSVKGIVFVLSIDKIQLGNAVRGFYGSDRINADEYLRRFIDLEYIMPEPDTKVFCEYLYNYFGFDKFLESKERISSSEVRNDPEVLLAVASSMFQHANVSLRQQEKVFAHTRIILNSFRKNNYVFPSLLITLVILRIINPEFYSKIRKKQFSLDELDKEFSILVPAEGGKYSAKYFTQVEANLIWMYNNSDPYKKIELINTDESGKQTSTIKPKYSEEKNFAHYLLQYMQTGDISIDYLINKIELTEMISL